MLNTDNIFFRKQQYEYKLHSLQSIVGTTRRTKTANITKDDANFAAR